MRNLAFGCVAFVPAEETFWQLTMLTLIMIVMLGAQMRVWPWCTDIMNVVDAAQSTCILGMVVSSYPFCGYQSDEKTRDSAAIAIIFWYYC